MERSARVKIDNFTILKVNEEDCKQLIYAYYLMPYAYAKI